MAQVIRKADQLGWQPLRSITYTGSPVAATPTLAGLQIFKGTISHNNLKDPQDPQWANDPEMKGYVAWMNKDYPQARHQERLYLLRLVAGGLASRGPETVQGRFQPRARHVCLHPPA